MTDLELFRSQRIHAFLSLDYYEEATRIFRQYVDAMYTSGRSDSAHHLLAVVSDAIRNAMDHVARASAITPDLFTRHRANPAPPQSERWIAAYLAPYRNDPQIDLDVLARKVIADEIEMAAWHLNLGKMHALSETTEAILSLIDEFSEFAMSNGRTDPVKTTDRRHLGDEHITKTGAVREFMYELDRLSLHNTQPNRQDIDRTATIVSTQLDTLEGCYDLLKYWTVAPRLPSLGELRRQARNRRIMSWFKQRGVWLVVSFVILVLAEIFAHRTYLRLPLTLVSTVTLGALGNDFYQRFFVRR